MDQGIRVKTDYEPIMARIARSQSHSPSREVGTGARTAIVDHGMPRAWQGTSAATPTMTVACTSDAEELEGVFGAMDTHEFGFARLMALADALGLYAGFVLSFLSSVTSNFRSGAGSIWLVSAAPRSFLRDQADGNCRWWHQSRKPRNV